MSNKSIDCISYVYAMKWVQFADVNATSVWKRGATENAGVENAGADSKGRKCRSRQAVWKAEPILYTERPFSYFKKIVPRLLSE